MRGVPGAGKDYFINQNNLQQYMLSADEIRLMFQSPILTEEGKYAIDARNDRKVWKVLFELLEERMKRGEFAIVNATHSKTEAINKYRKLAQQYRYRVTVVDFSDVPLETILEQNKMRPLHKHVPESVIHNHHMRMTTEKVPSWVSLVKPDELMEHIQMKPLDFSEYKRVHHIGDIHGCYTALREYLIDGIKEDELYIFAGDYLDRGIENYETLMFLMLISQNKNVIFLEGNHEHHIKSWSHGEPISSKEFEHKTAKQLEEHATKLKAEVEHIGGFKGFWHFLRGKETVIVTQKRVLNKQALSDFKKDVRQFYRKFRLLAYYTYHNKDYVVTHGGLSAMPENLMMLSAEQIIKGVGGYEIDIDYIWNQNEPNVTQIHGHRNIFRVPTHASVNSFNLEGQVEKGGYLRVAVLSEQGMETVEIKNDIFRIDKNNKATSMQDSVDEETFLTYLRSHDHIEERELPNGISSFNFSREAFMRSNWDDVNLKARGLFVNTNTNQIVARSYNKFFNVNEREETKINNLADNLVFPLYGYSKPNGYLGMVGYNEETDELVFSSKSQTEGPHAQWLKELFYDHLSPTESLDILEYLKNNNATLTFEPIKHLEDPHIIKYDHDKLILLDIVKRTVEYEKADYNELVKFAEEFGFEHKKLEHVFSDWQDFYSWYRTAKEDDSVQSEGYVFEDSAGFMFKMKLPYYQIWKQLRGIKDKVAGKHAEQVKSGSLYTPLHNKFFMWLKEQNPDYLKKHSIIELREEFYEEAMAEKDVVHQ